MRRLIINADDFGLTPGVNRATIEAHACGILTSATMMANAAAVDDALQRTLSAPTLAVGCHIVLLDGSPVLPANEIPDLIEEGTSHFHPKLSTFIGLALRRRIHPDQIEAEATAQIRKLQAMGIPVSHLDTHKHTHMFPQVLHPILRAARACGVSALRNPFEPSPVSLLTQHPQILKRWLEVKTLHALAGTFLRAVAKADMRTTSGTFGIAATGILNRKLFETLARQIPEGTWELVCHPGYNDQALKGVSTRLRESRELERQLLTSIETRKIIDACHLDLISYRDLL